MKTITSTLIAVIFVLLSSLCAAGRDIEVSIPDSSGKAGDIVTDDAVAKIEELVEASNGGFGAFLLFDHDWASPAAKLRSYELFAQYVIPHFTGQLAGPIASRDWVTASGSSFVDQAAHAIGKAIETHAAEQQAKQSAGQPAP